MCGNAADDPAMHDIEEDRPDPLTLEDIADRELIPAKILRQALRESHPDASTNEVVWAAHQIIEREQ